MLSQLVGPVTAEAAAVLIVLFAGLSIIVTTMVVKRRGRIELSNEHELAKMKQRADHERLQYIAETERATKFKQLEQGLITSHKSEN